MRTSTRVWRLALGLGLVVGVGVALASGAAGYRRARLPWRTFSVRPHAIVRGFVGDRAFLVVSEESPGSDVVSLEDGRVLNEIPSGFEYEPGSGGFLRHDPIGGLRLVDPVTGGARTLLEPGVLSALSRYAVSPTLDTVAFTSSRGLEVRALGASTSSAVLAHGPSANDVRHLAVSPGGDFVAAQVSLDGETASPGLGGSNVVEIWSRAKSEIVQEAPGEIPVFTTRGEVVSLLRGGGGACELFATTVPGPNKPRSLHRHKRHFDYSVAVLGERLAYSESDGKSVVVGSVTTGAVIRRVPTRARPTNEVLSANGEWLAIAFEDGVVEVWEIGP